MSKQKGSWRNTFFYLIGTLLYSLIFWFAKKNDIGALLLIILGMSCVLLYKMDSKAHSKSEHLKTKDIIYMCAGVAFDFLIGGYPFSLLPNI